MNRICVCVREGFTSTEKGPEIKETKSYLLFDDLIYGMVISIIAYILSHLTFREEICLLILYCKGKLHFDYRPRVLLNDFICPWVFARI